MFSHLDSVASPVSVECETDIKLTDERVSNSPEVKATILPENTQEAPEIVVHHSVEQGTIIRGETRVYSDVIKSYGFRWSARCGFWYAPSTRGLAQPNKPLGLMASFLALLGASTRIDHVSSTEDEALAAKQRILHEKARALRERAKKAEARSMAAYDIVARTLDMIPSCQPILSDHHSARRHRRDLNKIRSNRDKWLVEKAHAENLLKQASRLEESVTKMSLASRNRQGEEETSKPAKPQTVKEARAAYEAENPPSEAAKKVAEVASLLRKQIKRDHKVTRVNGIGEAWGKETWKSFCLTFASGHERRVDICEGKVGVRISLAPHIGFETAGKSSQEIYKMIVEKLAETFR